MFNPDEAKKFETETFGFVLDENDQQCISFITEYLHSKKGEPYRKHLKNVEFIEHPTFETLKKLNIDENSTISEVHFDAPPKPTKPKKILALIRLGLHYILELVLEIIYQILKIFFGVLGLD